MRTLRIVLLAGALCGLCTGCQLFVGAWQAAHGNAGMGPVKHPETPSPNDYYHGPTGA